MVNKLCLCPILTTVVLYMTDLEPYRTRQRVRGENFLIENNRVYFFGKF